MGRPAGRPVSARVSPHGFGPVRACPFKPVFKTGKNEGARSALGSASPCFARGPGPCFTSLFNPLFDDSNFVKGVFENDVVGAIKLC